LVPSSTFLRKTHAKIILVSLEHSYELSNILHVRITRPNRPKETRTAKRTPTMADDERRKEAKGRRHTCTSGKPKGEGRADMYPQIPYVTPANPAYPPFGNSRRCATIGRHRDCSFHSSKAAVAAAAGRIMLPHRYLGCCSLAASPGAAVAIVSHTSVSVAGPDPAPPAPYLGSVISSTARRPTPKPWRHSYVTSADGEPGRAGPAHEAPESSHKAAAGGLRG